mmetsp:Transcript_14993/g.42627  ORF Transcript_14993/g.42627 Transcript_14993/m.42627 type:complete len:232 (-) Transcript_14993:1345-2040(-)
MSLNLGADLDGLPLEVSFGRIRLEAFWQPRMLTDNFRHFVPRTQQKILRPWLVRVIWSQDEGLALCGEDRGLWRHRCDLGRLVFTPLRPSNAFRQRHHCKVQRTLREWQRKLFVDGQNIAGDGIAWPVFTVIVCVASGVTPAVATALEHRDGVGTWRVGHAKGGAASAMGRGPRPRSAPDRQTHDCIELRGPGNLREGPTFTARLDVEARHVADISVLLAHGTSGATRMRR